MQHNFEKEVQQTLDDLRLTPSETSWNNIASRLPHKKKRRALVFLWSAILTIMAGFTLWYIVERQPAAEQISGQAKPTATTAPEATSDAAQNILSNRQVTNLNKKLNKLQKPAEIRPQKQHQRRKATGILSEPELENTSHITPAPTPPAPAEELAQMVFATPLPSNPAAFPLEAPDLTAQPIVISSPGADWEVTKALTTDEKKQPGWTFELYAQPGLSFIGKSSTSSDPVFSMPTNPPGQDPIYNNNRYSSPPEFGTGTSYSLGMLAGRRLNKGIWVSGGLSYTNTIIPQQTRFVSAFETVLRTNHFNNTFHFVSLPVYLQIASKIQELPARWELSAEFAQLVSADVLQYENDQYFKDNRSLNKQFLSLQAGYAIKVLQLSSGSLYAGPYYQYRTAALGRKGTFSGRHIHSAGLRIGFKK